MFFFNMERTCSLSNLLKVIAYGKSKNVCLNESLKRGQFDRQCHFSVASDDLKRFCLSDSLLRFCRVGLFNANFKAKKNWPKCIAY